MTRWGIGNTNLFERYGTQNLRRLVTDRCRDYHPSVSAESGERQTTRPTLPFNPPQQCSLSNSTLEPMRDVFVFLHLVDVYGHDPAPGF